jgi:hypothetical protein
LLGEALELALDEVEGTPSDVLRRERRAKFRRMGIHA